MTKEDIEEYLKRILTLIRRDEVRRIGKRTTSEYEKINEKTLETTWKHKKDLMKLNEFNKKKRKCFKCEKIGHIRRFCQSKENLSKEKKDTFIVFEKSENENVLKKKRSQNEKL